MAALKIEGSRKEQIREIIRFFKDAFLFYCQEQLLFNKIIMVMLWKFLDNYLYVIDKIQAADVYGALHRTCEMKQ